MSKDDQADVAELCSRHLCRETGLYWGQLRTYILHCPFFTEAKEDSVHAAQQEKAAQAGATMFG